MKNSLRQQLKHLQQYLLCDLSLLNKIDTYINQVKMLIQYGHQTNSSRAFIDDLK